MAGGRPTDYDPKYCAMLVAHMAGGLSFPAFAGAIGVNVDTLYAWEKAHKEFSEAKREGLAANLIFWEKLGMTGIAGKIKNFSAPTYIFTMKNRHGWRDKIEHSGEIDTSGTKEKIKTLLKDPETKAAARKVALALCIKDDETE